MNDPGLYGRRHYSPVSPVSPVNTMNHMNPMNPINKHRVPDTHLCPLCQAVREKENQNKNKNNGFTLIEVIVSITILFLVIAAVFYFYFHSMDNQAKLKEKYRVLRIGREFVDSFVFGGQMETAAVNRGQQEVEDFILQWNSYPVEDPRSVILTSGIAPEAQLKRVHLEIIKKETGKSVLDLHFLVNTITPAVE